MRYEILDNGLVVNTIVASSEFMAAQYPEGNYREVDEPEPVQTPELRHISVGAFYDRFGAAKYAILADTNPMVQALIKDVSVRQYIDLDRADLPVGLQMLVDAGHAIDVDAVLSAPIQPEERP